MSMERYNNYLQKNQLRNAEKQLSYLVWQYELKSVTLFKLYVPLILALVRAKEIQKCEQYLKEMISKGAKPNLFCYNRMIQSYAQTLEPHHAERHLHELISHGLTPDVESYRPIVKAYLKLSQPDTARDFLIEQMEKRGGSFPPRVCSLLIKSYLDQPEPGHELVISLVKRMLKHQLLPDYRDVLSILKSLYRSHLPDEAESFLGALITASARAGGPQTDASLDSPHPSCHKIIRDLRTYHALMNAYAQASRPEDVERILMSLISPPPSSPYSSLNIVPTVQTFTITMNAYTSLSQFHRTEHIFNLLSSFSSPSSPSRPQIVPDLVCFTSLMTCYVESKRYNEALHTFHQLIKANLAPDTTCYNIYLRIIHGLRRQFPGTSSPVMAASSDLPLSYHLPSLTEEKNGLTSISCSSSSPPLGTDSYNTLIHNAVEMFHPQQGEYLLRLMICQGLAPNVITYSTLIHGYLKVGLDEDMQRLYQEMLSRDLCPARQTFHSFIILSCRSGDITRALSYVKEMEKKHQIKPSIDTYHHILDHFTVTNQLENAEILFHFLQDHSGLELNIRTYKYLLKLYKRNGEREKWAFLKKEVSKGLVYGRLRADVW
jgi:pentatricopeptide repeat protein